MALMSILELNSIDQSDINMNTTTRKATQTTNEQGDLETRVDAVEYGSSPGQVQETRRVEVIHHPHPSSATTGGILADAAAAVADTLSPLGMLFPKNNFTTP